MIPLRPGSPDRQGPQNQFIQGPSDPLEFQSDPFTEALISRIENSPCEKFSDAQLDALRQSLLKSRGRVSHAIDIRLSLNLIVHRFYLVFFLGRDRRRAIRKTDEERRRRASLCFQALILLLLAVVLSAGFLIFSAVGLYIIKSVLGIDLFPDKHLWDFFGSSLLVEK